MRGRPPKNLENQIFGRLTALRRVASGKWLCLCICGNTIEVRRGDLSAGYTNSCGCLRREKAVARNRNQNGKENRNFKHGHRRCEIDRGDKNSPTYTSWMAMMARCTNPNANGWSHYGGAHSPVTICDRWRDFRNFLADMGERPEDTTLGRFGDVGNYEPENCVWQNPKQQGAEQKVKRQLAFMAA